MKIAIYVDTDTNNIYFYDEPSQSLGEWEMYNCQFDTLTIEDIIEILKNIKD